MLTISFLINLGVLVSIVPASLRDTDTMLAAYGPASPARGIVVAVFITVMALCFVGLVTIALGLPLAREIGLMILPAQVLYKGLTAVTVGTSNPVVRANLAIAAFHIVTWATLFY